VAENDNIRFRYTRHAEDELIKRGVDRSEVEQTVLAPIWQEPDPDRLGVTRSFGQITRDREHYLRVAHRTDDNGDTVIITLHPDRGAKPPEDTTS